MESDGSIPGGCTIGAFVMGRNNGGARWNFSEGVLQLLVNLHITGGRTFKIDYTLADGTHKTANVAKMSKGTYCSWDVLAQAGIDEATAQNIRNISLINNNSGGEVRLYDMYVRVPVASPTAIRNLNTDGKTDGQVRKYILDGRIVIERAGQRYNAVGERLY